MSATRKPLHFMGSSHSDLKAFPEEARRDAGFNLDFVQRGLEPEDRKPMKTVGAGVNEIRVREASGAYRVIYLATRPEAVYVLHCFQKKTDKDESARYRFGPEAIQSHTETCEEVSHEKAYSK
jgi:phage-related protein